MNLTFITLPEYPQQLFFFLFSKIVKNNFLFLNELIIIIFLSFRGFTQKIHVLVKKFRTFFEIMKCFCDVLELEKKGFMTKKKLCLEKLRKFS